MRPLESFRFGDFVLDVAQGTLTRRGRVLDLRPQSFAVLAHLLRHAGATVPSSDLIVILGDPRKVFDNSLAQCIADIRRALDDRDKTMVRTVPRKGYRLAAPVTVQPATPTASPLPTRALDQNDVQEVPVSSVETQAEISTLLSSNRYRPWALALTILVAIAFGLATWLATPVEPPPLTMAATPTVLVLPFVASQDTVDQRQADVIAEAIATELVRGPHGFSLTVKAASSTTTGSPSEIARSLGARYLVRGYVMGTRLNPQLNVQLIEGPTGRQIVAQPFDISATSPVEESRAMTQIARKIAVQIRASEAKRPLPSQPEAGHYTILGRNLLEGERDAEETLRAQRYYRMALALNPDLIPALQGFARTHVDLVQNVWIPWEQHEAALAEANTAVEHLIKVAPTNVGAHLLRGVILRSRGEPALAIVSFERALSFNPNYTFAHAEIGLTKVDTGHAEETSAHIEIALRLSPADPFVWAWQLWAGIAALHTGDFNAAVDRLSKARQANRSHLHIVRYLALAYAGLGDVEKAKSLMTTFLEANPSYTIETWQRSSRGVNATTAAQRERLTDLMRALGVPER